MSTLAFRLTFANAKPPSFRHRKQARLVRVEAASSNASPCFMLHRRHGLPDDPRRQERDARRVDATDADDLA
jgi:hypothetical protein